MLLSERIDADGLTIHGEALGEHTVTGAWGAIVRADWEITLCLPAGRRMKLHDFSCEVGVEPTALDVLSLLLLSASTWHQTHSYDEWAKEYAINPRD